jgi:hypothetical protein
VVATNSYGQAEQNYQVVRIGKCEGKMLGFCFKGPLRFPSIFFQIHHCQPLQFLALLCVMEAKNRSCYHEASNTVLVCDFPPNSVTSSTSFCDFASASGIVKPLLCNKGFDCDQPIFVRVLEQDGRCTNNVTLWRVYLTTDAVEMQQSIVCVFLMVKYIKLLIFVQQCFCGQFITDNNKTYIGLHIQCPLLH